MNKNNNIRNIYIKCAKTYNKNFKNNFHKSIELKDENTTDKNNISFLKNHKLLEQNTSIDKIEDIQKSKPKEEFPNKNIYYNKNDKNKYLNKFFIDNIANEDKPMTNAVNIHNINLINSMNNITVYDSLDNKIPTIKKDIIKYPINKYKSQQFNTRKSDISKNNCSMDLNRNNCKKTNILVNKKKLLIGKNCNNNMEYNSINKYKNFSLSKKKNPFKELNYKRLNLTTNNFNSENTYNNVYNISNINKQEVLNSKNNYKNLEYTSNRDLYQEDILNQRNNSLNKRTSKDDNTIKPDFSIFNTFSNYTSSMAEEDINLNKNKMLLDKINKNRHNLINVNKLDIFKINNTKINNDIENNLSSYKRTMHNTNSNIKHPSGSYSNIFSLLSNKNANTNNYKSRFDIDNMNKIKKNINNEKIYKTRSENVFKNYNQRIKKTKSEEKNYKANKDNKISEGHENNQDITKKIQMFSSFLNENHKNTNKKNELGNIYKTDSYNTYNSNTFNHTNKYFYPNLNSNDTSKNLSKKNKKKNLIYPNRISYNKETNPQLLEIYSNKNQKENNYDSNIFEKIEVNKKSYTKNILFKNANKSQTNQKIKKSSENLYIENDSLKVYPKKYKKQPWVNSLEQINSFSNNMDYFCYLSNYIDKKEENNFKNEEDLREKSHSKDVNNVIYNKKPLLCHNKKGKQILEDKLISPDWNQRKTGEKEFDLKINDKNSMTEEIIGNNKINNINFEEELSLNNNYNYNENEIIDDISEKGINRINIANKVYLVKSPSSTIYKKPEVNLLNNSKSFIISGKESCNNKLNLFSSKIMENPKESDMNNSKKKNRKKYLNIKLNKLIASKEVSNNNNEINQKNIYLNNIIYNKDEFLQNEKESDLIHSISSYKTMKNNISYSSNLEFDKSREYIINSEQFSVTKMNQKIPSNNSFIKKYFCFFVDKNFEKKNCFISKIRYNKSKMVLYEIPIKNICFFSKKRKIFAKNMPKIDVCYFKKDFIQNENNKYVNKDNNNNIINNDIEEENIIINNEYFFNKKDNNDNSNLKFNSHQHSFTSLNSNENYFEISFGKKISKSIFTLNNENNKNNFNNNENILNKFVSPEMNAEEQNNTNKIDFKDNKFLSDNVNISPSKKNLNQRNSESYLKQTEKGLRLLEKIAGNRISPISNKKKSFFVNNNSKENNKKEMDNNGSKENNIKGIDNNDSKENNIKGIDNSNKLEKLNVVTKKLNEKCNKKINEEKTNINNSFNKKGKINNKIKNDFIELLNIITINNYDIILNKISDLILNNNIVTINNISNLYINQNEFLEIIISKSMVEKKYMKIYSKLCKDLFITLMIVIDNYNDDIDIFDKITKDKSLKVLLKNKICEKIEQFNFSAEFSFGQGDKNYLDSSPFYCDLKIRFTGLINFIAELLNVKLLSQKSGFEFLDILYKRYTNGTNNLRIYNDLNLEGIEILLSKIKIIVYEKNNPEHIQRYNKFIKNHLTNIFQKRIENNDLSKFLYFKLYNLIEYQKNEEEIKIKEKVKTFVCYKKKSLTKNDKNELIKNDNSNSFTISQNKYNSQNNEFNNVNYNIFIQKEDEENDILEVIKKDIEKFLIDSNTNEIKDDLFKEINKKYNEEINIKKKFDIWELFYYYVEVCIDIINSEDKIYLANKYIENIINNFTLDLPNENWEMLHYKLISLYLNINEICADNIYMYQIMGNLLFLLIKNKLFFIKDLNNFLNKDNEIIINIAKVVKYTIIFSDKDAKKFHNDFKQTKLFIGNEKFYNIVTVPLNKKFI